MWIALLTLVMLESGDKGTPGLVAFFPPITPRSQLAQPSVRRKRKTALMAVVRVGLLVASIWALRREFAGLPPAAIVHRLGQYGWPHLALGIAGVVASFLLLGAIEVLALRTSGMVARRVSHRAAVGTAFVAHALSQSVGVALLTGTAVRLRSYARRGLSATQVAQVSAAVTVTVTLGLVTAATWALLARSAPVAVGSHTFAMRPVGLLSGLTVAAYLAWSFAGKRGPAAPRRWTIPRPAPLTAVTQILLSTADWLVTGAVLYAFIQPELGLGFWTYLQIFIVAQLLAVLSHVPAGAGVFEVVLLALLLATNPAADRAMLLAAVVMYRVIYYLLPLAVAMLMAGVAEVRRMRNRFLERRLAVTLRPAPTQLMPDGR